MFTSPFEGAISWPDAGIAIAGVVAASSLATPLIWQLFKMLRAHLNRTDRLDLDLEPTGGSIANGEQG